ncbi:helix-turn-helix transcriptional regulator [Ancylobacter oerskovii]|uniref:Helix-turn-helix transcriptional regulator n=1 Tax=Ancylobacter oerskovii TaxID=459519 RepID=A0ABW4YWB2_9HYPH|nr:AraC family transcriptional regulator [Ancylobacter oerskovii]MBS7544193.1 helix-turn-helix transcriptional regulator [Ancylobacter oerskovii]
MPPRDATPGHRQAWTRLRVRDFLERDEVSLDSPDDRLSMEDTLIEGEFLHKELRPGLLLHVSNAREKHAFTATSRIREGISCIFFLAGQVDIRIGDRQFDFRPGRRGLAAGTAIVTGRPESFERTSPTPQLLRHLVVSATPEWLNVDGFQAAGGTGRVSRLFENQLKAFRWTLTPRLTEIVHQLFNPTVLVPELRDLYLEGRAVELMGESLAAMTQGERPDAVAVLAGRDLARLQRAKEFIAANIASALTVETIAREAGINASGLQRLFRQAEGVSIFEHVRKLRLEQAHAALRRGASSVNEASLIAGYTNPANFATAFRRQFGIAPSEALRARGREI